MPEIPVIIADDSPRRCNALVNLLQTDSDINLLSVNPSELDQSAQVLILSTQIPSRMKAWLNQAHQLQLKSLLLADDLLAQEQLLIHGLALGAKGVLEPQEPLSNAALAIKKIATGDNWVSRKMQGRILEHKLAWNHGSAIKKLFA